MERLVGTISRGVRAPIIRQGDDLAQIVVDSVLAASKSEGFSLHDRDVVAVTEAVVARAQGNYAHIDQIAADVRAKLGGETVGVLFPILSRNRFSVCLKGIARGAKKIVLMLSFPADEVGNHLIDEDLLDEKGVNPYSDVLTEAQYRALFGKVPHPFTGVDYVEFYSELIRENGAEAEIVLSNNPKTILQYTDKVLCCDIHTRRRTKRILQNAGASVVLGLDDILTAAGGWQRLQPQLRPARLQQGNRGDGQALPEGLRPVCGQGSRLCSRSKPAKTSRSWSTATAPSRTRSARSGSWPTRLSPRPTPPAWKEPPTRSSSNIWRTTTSRTSAAMRSRTPSPHTSATRTRTSRARWSPRAPRRAA